MIGLRYDTVNHVYTFDDSAGVTMGVVNAAFNYATITANEATLQPVNHNTQDFSSLAYTQGVTGVTAGLISLAHPTTFTDSSSQTNSITIGDGVSGLSAVKANVTITNNSSTTTNLLIADDGAPPITSTLNATSFTTSAPAGVGTISWTSASLTALGIDGGLGAQYVQRHHHAKCDHDHDLHGQWRLYEHSQRHRHRDHQHASYRGQRWRRHRSGQSRQRQRQGLNGTINLSTGGLNETMALTVNDSTDGNNRNVTIGTGSSLTGTMVHNAIVNYGTLNGLTVDGGTAHNTFTVNGTPSQTTTTLNSGTGNDTTNVTATSLFGSILDINGQGGTDTVNLTNAGSARI